MIALLTKNFAEKTWLVVFSFLFIMIPSIKAQGIVIVLNGTSSAGKTSLAQALQEQLERMHKRIAIAGWDACCYEAAFALLREKGLPIDPVPTEQEFFAQIPGQELGEKAEKLLLEKIKTSAQSNEYTIIDIVLSTSGEYHDFTSKIADSTIKHIIVYADPFHLRKHIEQRNAASDRFEHRPLFMPFGQFFSIYQPSDNNLGIDTLDTARLLELLEALQQLGEKELFSKMSDDERTRILEGKEQVIKLYRLHEQPTIAIKPVYAYDMMVNTGVLSPAEAAQDIVKLLFGAQK